MSFKDLNFFYLIRTNKDININNLYVGYIQNYRHSSVEKKFAKFQEGVPIANKNVNKIIVEYILPIVWKAKKIAFYSLDIGHPGRDRNITNFFKYIIKILNFVYEFNENLSEIKIYIVTGNFNNNNEQIILNKIIGKIKEEQRFKNLEINLKFHSNNKNIHPRSILADNVVISSDRIPITNRGYNIFEDQYNDYKLNKPYLDTATKLLKIKNSEIEKKETNPTII